MAFGGISSNYYSTYNNYSYSGYNGVDTWTDNANKETEKLKDSLGIDSSGNKKTDTGTL